MGFLRPLDLEAYALKWDGIGRLTKGKSTRVGESLYRVHCPTKILQVQGAAARFYRRIVEVLVRNNRRIRSADGVGQNLESMH